MGKMKKCPISRKRKDIYVWCTYIEVFDMAVNVDYVYCFMKNPFRKSVYGKSVA